MKPYITKLLTVATALAVGLAGGAAIAAQPSWMRPGDNVATLEDADRVLSWWRGAPRDSATYEPTSLSEANDRLWLTMGQVVDDLMGLDVRSRSFYMRRASGVLGGELESLGLRMFCDIGDFAVAGGWGIDDEPGLPVAKIGSSAPAVVAAGPPHAWDVSFSRVGPGRVVVRGYAVCASYGG